MDELRKILEGKLSDATYLKAGYPENSCPSSFYRGKITAYHQILSYIKECRNGKV